MIEIDGSYGEGGGQILRTALALSLFTQKPFRIERIRAGREKPGLRPQHLAAVRAAAAVGGARVRGDRLGSMTLVFEPGRVRPGNYRFAVGTAGATTLVFQTVFLPLALAGGESRVEFEGGTHVPKSPSLDFLLEVYRPWLSALGARFEAEPERLGFYPRGGGRWRAAIFPGTGIRPLTAEDRFRLAGARVRGAASRLPRHVAERIARRAAARLREAGVEAQSEVLYPPAPSPGAYGFVLLEGQPGPAGFTALGAPGKPAEQVGDEAARDALGFLAAGAAAEAHLADQLLLPLALARGPSRFRVAEATGHLVTQAWLIPRFLPVRIAVLPPWVEVRPGA